MAVHPEKVTRRKKRKKKKKKNGNCKAFCNKRKHNNFTLKNSLFGATNTVKNNVKDKFVYSGYGIAFNGAGEWSFTNDQKCYNFWC